LKPSYKPILSALLDATAGKAGSMNHDWKAKNRGKLRVPVGAA
jgi:hypothetical protein